MKKQNFELKNEKIRESFLKLKSENPERFQKRLNFSWSNWGFGMESLADSAERLSRAGIKYIELHGNHYGSDLGYKPEETLKILNEYGIKVAGVCGMFSEDNDLSSNRAMQRQAAIDYLKREIEFTNKVGGEYILVVPGAVGRSNAYDDMEFERSVETLSLVADLFTQYNVKAAIEPIRSAEVSFVHTVKDAIEYINAVNHPGVQHINGDVYHMQVEEKHIGEAILEAGSRLFNLHMADSNRCALGDGSLDIDTIIMALYLIGYNQYGGFVTPEPLGPGGAPYPAMYGKPDKKVLDKLVIDSYRYFIERENELLK
ncbi:sugar phosphate isomerase/epimerase [Clostridium sp. SYSU_GA19001]|uniref:sugar phosphate isomerase/epimerase family protein n=1 Tax=Clostridium caldaquaticum TaxID=2940653 RepID=UPI002076D8B3|nr:sugar phosphate isomerase/epimerase [Clostridium caldaquaticum]MCM8710009.1 sugar phosphate isomerase/epimerase [Clostridium caldaquaticum]